MANALCKYKANAVRSPAALSLCQSRLASGPCFISGLNLVQSFLEKNLLLVANS